MWVGTASLHKKMERRTLQACSLKHSIKKDMFSVLGKINLFSSVRGSFSSYPSPPTSTLPFLSPWLRASIVNNKRTWWLGLHFCQKTATLQDYIIKHRWSYNHDHNILRLFDKWSEAWLLVINWYIRVASWVAERLKT